VDAFARFISLHAGHRHYSPSDVANLRLVRPRLAGAIKEHEKVERILHIFEMNLFPEMLSIKQSLFSKLNFLILPLEDTIKNQVALKRATGDVHKIWRDWNFLLLENQLEDSSSVHSFFAFPKGLSAISGHVGCSSCWPFWCKRRFYEHKSCSRTRKMQAMADLALTPCHLFQIQYTKCPST
jgi:hypothetical protein